MNAPVVSVVIATYDSSHLLRYAIASVLCSDTADFEIVVVGDHCTDDSEAVVAAFADARIRFINLERNSGQQATPNNTGVAAARGEFIAFLNHDDLYLPHHLGSNLERIRRTRADILCSVHPVIPPEQRAKLSGGELIAIADGFEPTGRFQPQTFHVASSWFLRRAAAEAVGPWRLERQTWVTPSQDWLFRAWRSGQRIHYSSEMSVVVLYSGARKDFYRNRESAEHEFVFRNVIETDRLRGRLLESAQEWLDARLQRRPRPKPWPRRLEARLRATRDRWLARVLIACGIHPNTRYLIKKAGWRRGGLIRKLKQHTG